MGRAGSGKDSVADILCGLMPAYRFAFADLLKSEIAAAYNIDRRIFSARCLKETPLEQLAIARCGDKGFVAYAAHLAPLIGLKPRTIMQTWGDWRRNDDSSHFVRAADGTITSARAAGAELLVVTDVRFDNEAAWVLAFSGELWRIERPGLPVTSSHESEYATAALPAAVTIRNDGSLDDLRRIVVDLVSPLVEGHAA